jgi:hypothetical protein
MLGREAGVICSCVVFFGMISHCTGLTDLGPTKRYQKNTPKYLCAQQVYFKLHNLTFFDDMPIQ